MLNITKDELIARIGTLPQDLQDAIAAPETLEALEAIALTYQLDVVHVGLLHRLTVKLLAGVMAPREFVTFITEDLGIEQRTAMLIAQDINRDIFSKVRNSLKATALSSEQTPTENTGVVSPYAEQNQVAPTQTPSAAVTYEVVPPLRTVKQEVIIRDITPPARIPSNQVTAAPTPVEPAATRVANPLEAKLEGAFSLKKEETPLRTVSPQIPIADKSTLTPPPEINKVSAPQAPTASASAPLVPPPVLKKE